MQNCTLMGMPCCVQSGGVFRSCLFFHLTPRTWQRTDTYQGHIRWQQSEDQPIDMQSKTQEQATVNVSVPRPGKLAFWRKGATPLIGADFPLLWWKDTHHDWLLMAWKRSLDAEGSGDFHRQLPGAPAHPPTWMVNDLDQELVLTFPFSSRKLPPLVQVRGISKVLRWQNSPKSA